MAGKRREDDRACGCDRPGVSCVGLTVRRLSSERVHELAEEIWTAPTGRVLPVRPIQDPRGSRPGASAQAAYQRRTASVLRPLEQRGDLVLHDVTPPGWPASLEHLVVGPTGVWVIQSWRRAQPPPLHKAPSPWHGRGATAGPLPDLRWQAAAIADTLADGVLLPVRPLLCVPGGLERRALPGAATVGNSG
jgi:hypothetical protein